MRRRLTLIGLLVPAVVACAGSPGGGSATTGAAVPASCLDAANDYKGTVAATFRSTVGAIRRLPAVANNPQLAGYADTDEATVCYIDGQIPKGPPPPPSGTIPPSFDRAVLVVVGEESYFMSAGYSQNMPLQAPGSPGAPSTPASPTGLTDGDRAAVSALVGFARDPSADRAAVIPFRLDGVKLGTVDSLLIETSVAELSDSTAWLLPLEIFHGYAPPFSALGLIAAERDLAASAGPHDRCASPPAPPIGELVGMRQISVQPARIGSCLGWWAVDLWIDADGEISAITLDRWEP